MTFTPFKLMGKLFIHSHFIVTNHHLSILTPFVFFSHDKETNHFTPFKSGALLYV